MEWMYGNAWPFYTIPIRGLIRVYSLRAAVRGLPSNSGELNANVGTPSCSQSQERSKLIILCNLLHYSGQNTGATIGQS